MLQPTCTKAPSACNQTKVDFTVETTEPNDLSLIDMNYNEYIGYNNLGPNQTVEVNACVPAPQCFSFSNLGVIFNVTIKVNDKPFMVRNNAEYTVFCLNKRGKSFNCEEYEGPLYMNNVVGVCEDLFSLKSTQIVQRYCNKAVPIFPGTKLSNVCSFLCGGFGVGLCGQLIEVLGYGADAPIERGGRGKWPSLS